MADRFYVNSDLSIGPVLLEGNEAHHLRTVCRLRVGDAVYLFNGDGRQHLAHVASLDRREVALEVVAIETPQRELGFRLLVASAVPKGDRAQFLVEKLTELGVTDFVPLETARSVVHPGETKRDKWQRYIIEASKQCGRNVLMQVHPPVRWLEYCRDRDAAAHRWLADPLAAPLARSACPERGRNVALAVGPEGGFTDEEMEIARQSGWVGVGLGPRILRIETAALVLAALAAQARVASGE